MPKIRSVPVGGCGMWVIKTRPDDRDNFGFHMDWNSSSSPGSAGYVCVGTKPELDNLVALLRRYDPRDLFVDWGIR
jgi:lysozyme